MVAHNASEEAWATEWIIILLFQPSTWGKSCRRSIMSFCKQQLRYLWIKHLNCAKITSLFIMTATKLQKKHNAVKWSITSLLLVWKIWAFTIKWSIMSHTTVGRVTIILHYQTLHSCSHSARYCIWRTSLEFRRKRRYCNILILSNCCHVTPFDCTLDWFRFNKAQC